MSVAMFALCSGAQTFQIGADTPKGSQAPSSQEQNLGWGSNIQNARIARAAELALQKGDHAQALDYARRAVESAPNDAQLWFLLGYAARLNNRYQESVNAYDRGLRINPQAIDGLSGLAQDYAIMGRTNDATRILKQIVASHPSRRNDVLLLGDLSMRLKDYTQAVDWLNHAERMQPDTRSEILLAISYQQLKRMDLANHYLTLAKDRSPGNPDVERTLAGYYRESHKYDEAIAALKSIRNPHPDVIAELAYTYQLNGNLSDAAKSYAQAANAATKDLTLQVSAAQAQVAAGQMDQATPFLQRAASIDPNYYRLHAIRGEIAHAKDDDRGAISEYNEAIAHLPAIAAEGPLYGIQLHMDLMDLYRAVRDKDAAQKQLDIAQSQINAVDGNVADRDAYLRLRSLIEMNAGQFDKALSDIQEALAANDRQRDDLQIQGDILMKLNRTEDAIASYKKVLDIDANNRFALISLGYASRAAGRNQEAEHYFKRLAQIDPSSYIPYLALGDLYTSRREFNQAQASYSKAYAISPKHALIMAGGMNAAIEAHNIDLAGEWLGRLSPDMDDEPQVLREKERYYSFHGDYQRSADVAQQAIQVLPTDRDVIVYLGYDLLHLERYQDLLALTQKYNDVLPKEPDIPLLAGYVHKQEGQSEQAREDFTEALKRDASVVTAYVNRGYMLNDLHQPQSAAADFETALKSEPDNGEAHLGLAYSDLDLHKLQASVHQADLAEKLMGDSRDVHVIRATAYGRQSLLTKAAREYRAALKFTPDDPALHLGLGSTLFGQRHYHEAIEELTVAEKLAPKDANVDAMLARSYANLDDRDHTLQYVQLAQQKAAATPPSNNPLEEPLQSSILVSTGEALDQVGERKAAMDNFRKALETPRSNRVGVRLAIAQVMSQQDHQDNAQRQIALAVMEAQAGETTPPSGTQYVQAADVFRGMHEFRLSQDYLERAKAAGAPDTQVRVGMADNYLALGDTTRASAELDAVSAVSNGDTDYQYLLAKANVYRQQHRSAQALTSFAQASDAQGEDQAAEQGLLAAGADEGFRITPKLSLLGDVSVDPIFEDSTVYVLDAKTDATFPVGSTQTNLLPPPRSTLQTQTTEAYHLHLGPVPVASGFFQLRNARGQISVPATNSVVNRNTYDYNLNFGLNPTIHMGTNVITFDSGIQGTFRRDSVSPSEMNQNLFRVFTYMTTSSFFNALSISGYVIHEAGPFTQSNIPNLRSHALTGALDFRVGAPWGRTALITGWGSNDQVYDPVHYENYYTSSYIGFEHRFSDKLNLRAILEDVRAWRVVGTRSGIAQNLRPAATVDFTPHRNWDLRVTSAYSSTRSFHTYDATQNGFSLSYAKPVRRKFHDDSGAVVLEYPIRFSAGVQEETFFNFSGGHNQIRPYVGISFF